MLRISILEFGLLQEFINYISLSLYRNQKRKNLQGLETL